MGLRMRSTVPADRARRASGLRSERAEGPATGPVRGGYRSRPLSVSPFPFAFLRSAADLLRSALPGFERDDVVDAEGLPTGPGAAAV